ncbi:MAG: hypothetical protein R3C11_26430 [Planctomycetaceae bacterium]
MDDQQQDSRSEEQVELEIVEEPSRKDLSGKESYNIVTDTLIGYNGRRSDNVFQAKAIGISLLLGAVLGTVYIMLFDPSTPWPVGAIGGTPGIILGLFGSGFYLMIYRMVKHLKGDHD